MRPLPVIVVFALVAGAAHAQPVPGACERFSAAYDRAADRAARLRAEGLLRTQVVESTANSSLLANELAVLQLNLELMKGASCPLPKAPLDLDIYVPAITACVNAPSNAPDKTALCDRRNWKPTPAP